MTTQNVLVANGPSSLTIRSEVSATDGSTVFHQQLEQAGIPVAADNPLPTQDAGASTLLAAIAGSVAYATMTLTVAQVTVPATTVAPTPLLAANPTRKYLAYFNTGTNPASVGVTNSAAACVVPVAAAPASGQQGGGFLFDAVVPGNAIWALSSAGTTFAVIEGN